MKRDVMDQHKKNRAKVHADSPLHADVIEMLKDQLLIVFLRRIVGESGDLAIEADEIDDTGRYLLAFNVVGRTFTFELRKKPS
jgi:hypothetical protein